MKRLIPILCMVCMVLIAIMVPSVSLAEKPKKNKFYEPLTQEEIADMAIVRGFIWGLPKEIIKAEEKGKFGEEEENALYYVDTIRGVPSSITYEFSDNKLFRVRIFTERQYPVLQERVDDYIQIKKDISTRFGWEGEETFVWKNEREKKYPQFWGNAVYSGDLQITTVWDTKETLITAYMGSTKPFNPVTVVTYESKLFQEQLEEKSKKEDELRLLP